MAVGNKHPDPSRALMSMTLSTTRANKKRSKAKGVAQMHGSRELTFFARRLPGEEGVASEAGQLVEGAGVIMMGQVVEAGAVWGTGAGDAIDKSDPTFIEFAT